MTYPKMMELDPSSLKPNPWNTNIVTPENEAKLEESIKRLGFFRPAVVREIANSSISDLTTAKSEIAYEILGGEHRAQVAAKLGLKTIPVVNLGPIDDLKAKEIGIADNSRYGMDDQLAFAELIKGMGNAEQLKDFLPYTEHDFTDLFTTSEIDLDSLGLEENFEKEPEKDQGEEPVQPKAPKTHTIIRYKVTNRDAEDITALIERTMQDNGFTGSDDLTNAGDALVHLLFAGRNQAAAKDEMDDLDELLDGADA
ncbi:ParB N-terminal domain-containing protein [Rhizobium lentis]|uniref:ParB/RepB/Spo0J family partition protein n=1 Tax=Rhizobium lentis TaxID=1138194 RepID=UPI001C830B42|nr:ParB/RepB/Spo0J family partition protein [Rhizobium lentis]MBX5130802.1 ParB N-terminal domain-containing protein [Rhizobium lentis]